MRAHYSQNHDQASVKELANKHSLPKPTTEGEPMWPLEYESCFTMKKPWGKGQLFAKGKPKFAKGLREAKWLSESDTVSQSCCGRTSILSRFPAQRAQSLPLTLNGALIV